MSESTTENESTISNIARATAIKIVNTDKVKRLTEWNPHKGQWEIEVVEGDGNTVTVVVPSTAPGLNNEARHAAKGWTLTPDLWRRSYADWVGGGSAPGDAVESAAVDNARQFPDGPAMFNYDVHTYTPAQARAHLDMAKKAGAQIIGCSYCHLTAKGDPCVVCDNPGQRVGGATDAVQAFREMVALDGNAFVVGANAGKIVVINVGPMAGRPLDIEEAVNLAAWVVTVVEATGYPFERFLDLLDRIKTGKAPNPNPQ